MTELDMLRVFYAEAVAWTAKQYDRTSTSMADVDELAGLASSVYGEDLKKVEAAQVAPAPVQVAPPASDPAPAQAAA